MREREPRGRTALVLLLVFAIVACGASSPGIPESRPQDYPPIRTILVDAPFELAPGDAVRFDFRIPESEPALSVVVFATIDWTHSSNNVVAAIGGEACGGVNLALAGACGAGVYQSRPSLCTAKPRVVTASGTSGALLRLYVANTGSSPESGRAQVVACQDAPGCAEGLACGQCGLEAFRVNSC